MNTTFEDSVQSANVLLNSGQLEQAIEHYQQALTLTDIPEHKIDLLNTIGRAFLGLNRKEKAIQNFEASLGVHNSFPQEKAHLLLTNKATIYNNLGALYLNIDIKKAIEYHKSALAIFEAIQEDALPNKAMYVSNTSFSLAEAYQAKKDHYMARKYFNAAIESYTELRKKEENNALMALQAKAHYAMGDMALEDTEMLKAHEHFNKALMLYQELSLLDAKSFRPILAATQNNLGVTCKMWEKYDDAIKYYLFALEQYEILVEENRAYYLPFLGATHNSLAIVFSEKHEVKDDFSMGTNSFSGFGPLSTITFGEEKKQQREEEDKQKAKDHYLKALDIYNELCTEQPEMFRHYLATIYHNLALLYDEKKEINQAAEYYRHALALRKRLAGDDVQSENFGAFGADVAATILNYLTIIQQQLESSIDFSKKDTALELIKDAEKHLSVYDEEKAVFKSMKSDLSYFKEYFRQADRAFLEIKKAFRKIDELSHEISSVLEPEKKLQFQTEALNSLVQLQEKYSDNKILDNEIHHARVGYAYLALRSNQLDKAQKMVKAGMITHPNSLDLKMMQGHIHLVKNENEKAEEIYASLDGQRNADNEEYKMLIERNRQQLQHDGVI